MTEDKQKPTISEQGARQAAARQDRLAKALRQNLARRKAQQRARDSVAEPPLASAPTGSSDTEA